MKIIDVWFSKPLLSSGRWCCQSVRADEWRVTGNGHTPQEAFADMKRIIVAVYKRAAQKVEFVSEAEGAAKE